MSASEKSNDNKKFEKLQDALEETKRRLEVLRSHLGADKALITDESRSAIWKINRSYHDWPSDWHDELSSFLCEENYPEVAVAISKQLFDSGGPAVDEATCKFSLNLFTSLWHFSKFAEFRLTLVAKGVVPLLIDYLTTVQVLLEHLSSQDPPEEYPLPKWAILKAILNIIREIAKQRDFHQQLTLSKTAELLEKFTTASNEAIQLTVACCLAYIATFDVLQQKFEKILAVLTNGIKQALDTDLEHPTSHALEVSEIADSLLLLVSRSGSDDEDLDELLDEDMKPRQVAELIVSEDETVRKCGVLLFQAYCNKEADADWERPLFRMVMLRDIKGDANSIDDESRAAKAAEFVVEYNNWMKQRHGTVDDEDEDDAGASSTFALEIDGFATKRNSAINTLDEAKNETEMRIKFLGKLAELTPNCLVTTEVGLVFGLISDYYVECDPDWKVDLASVIVREGLPAISAKYLAHFVDVGLDKASSCALGLLGTMWNQTDISPQIRLDLAKAGVLKIMLNYLAGPGKSETRTSQETYLIFVMINTIYNMSRSIELKAEFLELDAANILKEYLTLSTLIQSIVMLCLAHILSDTPEATQLAHEQGVVPNIIKYINLAMSRTDRSCVLIVTVGGTVNSVCYSTEELVEGLALLAVNDAIKEEMMKNNACSIIDFLLKSEEASLEDLGVDLIWTLSFEQSARSQILNSPEKLVDSLKALTTSTKTKEEVRQHAIKALTFIEHWENKVAEAEATGGEESGRKSASVKPGHIFLSYSWKQQETVLRIKQELLKHNYTVWMDVEKMHGDLLEAMAEAIEKASVVVICFSNTYKQSNPCRTEAQYAHALCKPIVPVNMEYHYFPDGWLGILVRSRKFVDMSLEKRKFEAAFEQLLEELKAFGTDDAQSEMTPMAIQPLGGGHSTAPPPSETAVHQQKQSFVNWSTGDVQNWLQRENIAEFTSALADFDGKMLATLLAMKSTAPDFYYKTVSKHYNGTLQGLLRLLGALDRLWLE